jgi:hypothetical protein
LLVSEGIEEVTPTSLTRRPETSNGTAKNGSVVGPNLMRIDRATWTS